jgi:hypothetical protein
MRNRFSRIRASLPLYLSLTAILFLLISSGAFAGSKPSAASSCYDGCDTMGFNVREEGWRCLKSFLKDQDFGTPAGNTGQIQGRGVIASAAWSDQKLSLTITDRSTFSCEQIQELLQKAISDCSDLVESTSGSVVSRAGSTEVWRIDSPNVANRQTRYTSVNLRQGDTVSIAAGGCVQTGGSGRTWKLYVNPSGDDSDKLYHGLIKLPGMERPMRIVDFIKNSQGYSVSDDVDMKLRLGYEDDNYRDNGYWGHDDGTENQCEGVGNAWVQITIVHH